MAQAKKGKKGKTLSLAEFQGNSAIPEGFNRKTVQSWADAMEDGTDVSLPPMKAEAFVLPTAPKSSRPNEVDTSRVPTKPPFKLYIANIPYDVTDEAIEEFFLPLETSHIQLPKGDRGSRGFGYIEFKDRDSLIAALSKDGQNLGTRPIRVSLPDEGGNREDGRRDRNNDRMDGRDPTRSESDWRREPRELPPMKDDQYGNRDRDGGRGMGFERSSGFGSRNGEFQPHTESRNQRYNDSERDFGDVRQRDPKFSAPSASSAQWSREPDSQRNFESRRPFVPAPLAHESRPSYNDRYQDRYQNDDRRSNYRAPYDTPREQQTSDDRDDQGPPAREPPQERKRLVLKPRSKPVEEIAAPAEITSRTPFGDAKPVNTREKELEIEAKIQKLTVSGSPTADGEGASRERRTSTGSNRSGQRSRQTSESGSHHGAPPQNARSNYNRQDSEGSHTDRRPPRILNNENRERRDFGDRDRRDFAYRDDRSNFRDGHRDHHREGGYNDRPSYRRDDHRPQYDNGRSGQYEDRNYRSQRGGHYDNHNNQRNSDRNVERRDQRPRTERPAGDRPRNDSRIENKEPEYTTTNKFGALLPDDADADYSFDAADD